MIFTTVWHWVMAGLTGVVSLFPTQSVPAQLAWGACSATNPDCQGTPLSSYGVVWQYLDWANQYLPLDAVLSAAGVMIGLWSAMWLLQLVLWILTKLHVAGGD